MKFFPKKPLQTLSDFITQLEAETSTFTSEDALEIVAYNNFLKQPITVEMFRGEEKIFFATTCIGYGNYLKKFKTVADLAELDNFEFYIKA